MRIFFIALLCCAVMLGAEMKLGKPLAVKDITPIANLTAKPADYVGKTVAVTGKVSEVCQEMGCWMQLVDPATKAAVKIKVKDGEIVFPKDSIGKMATAEGVFKKIEMTKEQAIAQAQHEAEANKKKFDSKSITSPVTIYQIAGTGAVIQ